MTYRLEIRPEVLADIDEAAQWYEMRESGLGAEFATEIVQAINDLPANPLIYRIRHRRYNVRWRLPRKFPYRIVYRLSGDLITVFAVITPLDMIVAGKGDCREEGFICQLA